MPTISILEVELFDIWEIEFIEPFLSSFTNECVFNCGLISKLVEVVATSSNDA